MEVDYSKHKSKKKFKKNKINPIEENENKLIDLKKAQQKIKEMEKCLKTMNIENDDLKGKLGNIGINTIIY